MLRKSVTGLFAVSDFGRVVDFVEVGSGGVDIVFSLDELVFAISGLPTVASGLGFVAGGDLAGSVSSGTASFVSTFFGVDSSLGASATRTGDAFEPRGTGLSSASDVSGTGAAFVSSVKFDVSSLVVGAAIFSDSCRDSCVSALVGLELRPNGLAFVGGVTDRVLPVSGRISLESERLSKAGPNGVSLVGDEGLL